MRHVKCKIVDLKGYEIDNDDVEFFDDQSAAFLMEAGEKFDPKNALALYKEIKVLGTGGFGTVKLYRHRTTDNEVAVKFQTLASA